MEVRRIKARVDEERLPRGADPHLHLKLGRGGLADIEWTVQLLQMRHAGQHPGLRTPRTLDALPGRSRGRAAGRRTTRRRWPGAWRSVSADPQRGHAGPRQARPTSCPATRGSGRRWPRCSATSRGRPTRMVNDYLRTTRRAHARGRARLLGLSEGPPREYAGSTLIRAPRPSALHVDASPRMAMDAPRPTDVAGPPPERLHRPGPRDPRERAAGPPLRVVLVAHRDRGRRLRRRVGRAFWLGQLLVPADHRRVPRGAQHPVRLPRARRRAPAGVPLRCVERLDRPGAGRGLRRPQLRLVARQAQQAPRRAQPGGPGPGRGRRCHRVHRVRRREAQRLHPLGAAAPGLAVLPAAHPRGAQPAHRQRAHAAAAWLGPAPADGGRPGHRAAGGVRGGAALGAAVRQGLGLPRPRAGGLRAVPRGRRSRPTTRGCRSSRRRAGRTSSPARC